MKRLIKMNHAEEVLSQLIALSRKLGDPALDLAMLGEGNTSGRIDSESFWVKASGAELRTIDANGFVQVSFAPILALLEANLSDEQVKAGLESARVDPQVTRRPSVETFLHALALQIEGIQFVGHTHPTLVNAILCSQKVEEAISGRLFPDEVVYCGPAPVYIPYTDPGLSLARAVRSGIEKFYDDYNMVPKVILMQNHGLIVLGKTPGEVEHTTAMYVKAARVLLGTYALGGPHFLSADNVARIHNRPDINYRRNLWGLK
jgi:rhamnose utilization protein RhaD (predicted bifunctional aldolase and dehydrogenase)